MATLFICKLTVHLAGSTGSCHQAELTGLRPSTNKELFDYDKNGMDIFNNMGFAWKIITLYPTLLFYLFCLNILM